MDTATRLMTAEELIRMPEDGYFYELVRGEMKKMTPGGGYHGYIGMSLGARLTVFVEEHGLGAVFTSETGFILSIDPDTVRAPDVAFVREDRIPPEGIPEKYWPGAPDLAVEVISPNDTVYEVEEKVDEYLQAGTSMVVVINPRHRKVRVHRPDVPPVELGEGDTFDGEDVVPGFCYEISRLFTRQSS